MIYGTITKKYGLPAATPTIYTSKKWSCIPILVFGCLACGRRIWMITRFHRDLAMSPASKQLIVHYLGYNNQVKPGIPSSKTRTDLFCRRKATSTQAKPRDASTAIPASTSTDTCRIRSSPFSCDRIEAENAETSSGS